MNQRGQLKPKARAATFISLCQPFSITAQLICNRVVIGICKTRPCRGFFTLAELIPGYKDGCHTINEGNTLSLITSRSGFPMRLSGRFDMDRRSAVIR